MSAFPQKEYCLRAVAYLKVVAPDDNSEVVELSHNPSPVLKDIGHGLLVAYLVDEDQYYSYVQQQDLEGGGISENELHSSAVNNLRAIEAASKNIRQANGESPHAACRPMYLICAKRSSA